MNNKLVPPHTRPALEARGLYIDDFKPLTKEEMMAHLDWVNGIVLMNYTLSIVHYYMHIFAKICCPAVHLHFPASGGFWTSRGLFTSVDLIHWRGIRELASVYRVRGKTKCIRENMKEKKRISERGGPDEPLTMEKFLYGTVNLRFTRMGRSDWYDVIVWSYWGVWDSSWEEKVIPLLRESVWLSRWKFRAASLLG